MGNNSHHWKTEDSCWKIDQMPKNYEPQRQYQERKALIVVGRMGHGKSSFCKTIVSDSQKHKVKAQNSLKSVTTECTLYESDKFVDIFEQNIYVIDTPGLDSKDASYIIIQEIDNIISQQKLSILGIAYVVDIHQRQKNEKGQNYIFTFFETLRMRFEYKRNISFCVLSKWDKYYDQQQGNNQVFFQMEKEFYKIRFGDTWHRKMFWMSEPTSDVKKFYINVNSPELKPIYQNQMKRLKEFLYLVWNANLTLHYSIFKQDRKTFYNIHLQEMRKEYSSFEYRKQGGDIQLNSTTPPVRYSFFERALQFFGIYKEYKLEQLVNFITKEQINFINESKYKACLQTMITSNVYITHNRTIFKRANYIEDVKCYNQYGHFIFLHRDNDGNKFAYLEPGSKHKIIFTCRFPTNQCYSQFIRRISKEFFNRNHLK